MIIKKVERTPMKIKTKKGIEIHSLSSPSIHAQVTRIKEKRNTSDLYLNKDDGNRVSRSAEKIRGIPKKKSMQNEYQKPIRVQIPNRATYKVGQLENVYLKSVVLSRKSLKVRSYEDSLRIKDSADATNLYQKAFQIIEGAYPCSRLLALHRFLINIEMQGGKYQNAIDLLQVDIRAWVERSYVYQKELKNIKNKIILSLGISLGICGTMIAIVPDEISIKGITIYQIVTTLLLIIFLAIFTIVQTKLNGSWLVNDTMDKTSDRVLRAYDYVRNYNSKEAGKKSIIKAAIFSIVTLVLLL